MNTLDIQPETVAQANPFLTSYALAQGIDQQSIANRVAMAQANAQIPYMNQLAQAQANYATAQTPNINAQTNYLNAGQTPQAQANAAYQNQQANMIAWQLAHPNTLLPGTAGQIGSINYVQPPNASSAPSARNSGLSNIPTNIPGQNSIPLPPPTVPGAPQGVPQGAQPNSPPSMPTPQPAGLPTPPQGNGNVPPDAVGVNGMDINKLKNLILGGIGLPIQIQQAQLKQLDLQNNYTPDQINAIQRDNSSKNMLIDALPGIQAAASYSGIAGQAQLAKDKFLAATGQTPSKNYQAYLNFVNTQAPNIASEYGLALGTHATDVQTKEMKSIANPITWEVSPQNALNQLQALANSVHANAMSMTQNKTDSIAQGMQPPIQIPGATVGTSQTAIQIPPSIKTQAQFMAWAGTLGPQEKAQLRAQYGGGQ